MAYKLKFGIRGGLASQEYLIPSKKMAESIAMDITNILTATTEKDWNGSKEPVSRMATWKMHSNCPFKSWASSYHFISLEKV